MRLPQLDGIRGVAILLVVIYHYCYIPAYPDHLHFLSLTWSGVDLFFVLSGFLIGGILLDNRSAPNYFSVFYLRRFLRIFPLYYVVLIIYLIVLHEHVDTTLTKKPISGFWYFLYLQNFIQATYNSFGADFLAVTWSLAVEEQFYLFLPFFIRKVKDRHLIPVILTMICLAPVFRIALHFIYPARTYAPYLLLFGRMDALMMGVLAAVMVRRGIRIPRLGWIAAALSIPMILFSLSNSIFRMPHMATWGYTVVDLFYFSLLLLAVEKQQIIYSLFTFKPLCQLGLLAYGVYLLHGPINIGLHEMLTSTRHGNWAVSLLAFAVTLALATLSWRLFERPLVGVGHKFRYGGQGEVATAIAN